MKILLREHLLRPKFCFQSFNACLDRFESNYSSQKSDRILVLS